MHKIFKVFVFIAIIFGLGGSVAYSKSCEEQLAERNGPTSLEQLLNIDRGTLHAQLQRDSDFLLKCGAEAKKKREQAEAAERKRREQAAAEERRRREQEEEARKPTTCYDLSLYSNGYWIRDKRLCSKRGAEDCQAERNKYAQPGKCEYVSSTSPPAPPVLPPPTVERACYTLYFYSGPGPGVDFGDFCGERAKDLCFKRADEKNRDTISGSGRWGCRRKD